MPTAKSGKRRSQKRVSQSTGKQVFFGVSALIAFLLGLAPLSLLVSNAEKLVWFGLVGNIYYITLIPFGLCVAFGTFGCMRSYGHYRGKNLGGKLELGGPIIAVALVVGAGIYSAPGSESFALTVYVHGEAGPQEMLLRDTGNVVIDLGPDRRIEAIGAKGEAYFPSVPSSFRGQEVPVWVDAEGFEVVDGGTKRRLDGSSLYLPVQRTIARIAGKVMDETGLPVAGAMVEMAGLSTKTDASGNFEFFVQEEQPPYAAQIIVTGYQPWRGDLTASPSGATIMLKR